MELFLILGLISSAMSVGIVYLPKEMLLSWKFPNPGSVSFELRVPQSVYDEYGYAGLGFKYIDDISGMFDLRIGQQPGVRRSRPSMPVASGHGVRPTFEWITHACRIEPARTRDARAFPHHEGRKVREIPFSASGRKRIQELPMDRSRSHWSAVASTRASG